MASGCQFEAYKGKLIIESGPFQDIDRYLSKRIEEHAFNHGIEILIPGMDTVTSEVSDWLSSPDNTYYVANLPVNFFVNFRFIENVIKKGKFSALSYSRIDTANSVAVLPSGMLLLSLDKDTYEQLGLNGKQSVFRKKDRFIVQINLIDSSFVPEKKLYNRILWCLTNRLDLHFKFWIAWLPSNNDYSVLESWLSGHNYFKLNYSQDQFCHRDCTIPHINYSFPMGSVNEKECSTCDVSSFYEWLGIVSCRIDSSVRLSDDYISSYSCPMPKQTFNSGISVRCKGFITTDRITDIVKKVREKIHCYRGIPWIVINVWGFSDSPVSWQTSEHNFLVSGDNNYTIILFTQNSQAWFIFTTSDYDAYS